MYVICNRANLAVKYAPDIKLVRLQRNGVVVPTTGDLAEAIYCPDDDSYWPLKADKPWDTVYHYYSIKNDEETIPAGAAPGVTYFDRGAMSIDPDLKQAADAKADAEAKAARVSDQATYVAKLYAEQQTDEATMLMLADLYEAWAPNRQYKAKKIISYGVDAYGDTQLYQVVQDHTSADYWLPDATPSMYAPIGVTEDGYLKWRQPYGSTDAYDIGDIVSYNGQLWKCTGGDGAGKNSWAPGVYGWELYTPDSGETTDPAPEPEPEPEPGTEPDPETPSYEEWQSGQVHKIGDIVSHNGKLWVCTQGDGAGNNSWEPGVYGWEEYTQE